MRPLNSPKGRVSHTSIEREDDDFSKDTILAIQLLL
jgi:hypothetical protein